MKEPASGVSDRPAKPSGGDFEAFFEAEHERLLRALFVVTGSAEEADELMQDAFVAVWERWDWVGGMHDPTGYLYRTAMNRFRSRLRSARAAEDLLVASSNPAVRRLLSRGRVATSEVGGDCKSGATARLFLLYRRRHTRGQPVAVQAERTSQ
jgi:hypothetical protein